MGIKNTKAFWPPNFPAEDSRSIRAYTKKSASAMKMAIIYTENIPNSPMIIKFRIL
jgi:hypothetical protein